MTTSHTNLPVAQGSAAGLAAAPQPVLPPTLMPVSGDDFLPGPGPWASQLGRQLLALMLLGCGALALWPMREVVKAPGVIRPTGENTLLQSEQGGTVLRVLMRPNQQVRAGELLAVFDSRSLQAERRQLLEELATLQAQEARARDEQRSLEAQASALERLSASLTEASRRGVDQAEAMLDFDRSELQRYRTLLDSGAVPRSLVDEKQARAIVSRSEVLKAQQGVAEERARGMSELARLRQNALQSRTAADELRKQVFQRQARLLQVQRGLDLSSVRAPISGSVLSTDLHHSGQVVRPGDVMAVLAPSTHQFEARLLVPSEHISQLRAGQAATLRVASCPTPEFGVLPARVASVAPDTVPLTPATPGAAPPRVASGGAYEVVLQPSRSSLRSRQSSCNLRLGMEVSADVVTRRTTVLGFLLNKLRLGL